MKATFILMLAQADPDDVEVTAGAVISGAMVLLAMAASLSMLVVWWMRFQQFGYWIPAAQRGVLRVSPLLLSIVFGVAVLIALLAAVMSFSPSPDIVGNVAVPAGGVAVPATDITDDMAKATDGTTDNQTNGSQARGSVATDTPAVSDESDISAADTPENTEPDNVPDDQPEISPERLMSNMVQMLLFDIVLVAVMGAFVFAASHAGRVWLPDMTSASLMAGASAASGDHVASAAGRSPFSTMAADLWPDLDADVESGAIVNDSTHSSANAIPQESPDVPEGHQAVSGDQPEVERFSFATELRYAVEVFLAAFLPTIALRLIIIGILVAITGKQPESHPFLEMMDDGVGIPILLMIALMAIFVAPVAEELMYRVIILGGMAQVGWPKVGLIVSSVIFCLAHGFPDSLALLPLAFALGYTYLRRRSYITVMLVHFLFNSFNMLIAGVGMAVLG